MLAKIIAKLLEWVITIIAFAGVTILVALVVMMGVVTIGTILEVELPYKVISLFAIGVVFITLTVLTVIQKRKTRRLLDLLVKNNTPPTQ